MVAQAPTSPTPSNTAEDTQVGRRGPQLQRLETSSFNMGNVGLFDVMCKKPFVEPTLT